jgi:hypothetical protein
MKSVLYITTQITGTSRYFSWAAYPSIWYARLQKDVLNILESYVDFKSYVKFYPNDILKNPNVDWVKHELKNVQTLEDSLIDILTKRKFDLIVTEACATTLLEILCTKSQILCYFPEDYIKIDDSFLAALKKRAYVANSEKNYTDLLSMILNQGFDSVNEELNDEFLFKFGLGGLTSSPSELVKRHLSVIIEK